MSSKGKSSADTAGGATLVPKLRFPEFQDAGAWENKLLAPFLRDSSGRAPSNTTLPVFSSTREGLRRQDAYFDGRVLQNNNDYGVVPPGCFVYRHMSDDGTFKFNINNTGAEIAVSKEYPVFETVGLDSKFLLELLNEGEDFKHFAFSQKAGGTRTRLYFSRLREWRTHLPTLPEQQKIADCLDSVDALIAAQGRKVAALRAHKKGLMQQLFPRPERIENGVKIPAETIPRLRFPEYRTAGDWGRAQLGPKTDKVGSGITPNGGDRNYRSSGRPFVRSQNVGWGELLLDDVAFLDEETHSAFASTEIRLGDVLLNITGASIGRSAVADRRIVGGNVNQHVCIIRVKQKAIDQFYLNQYLISQYGQKQIDNFQAGGNRQGLNFAQIRTFSVPLPPTMPEQHRIAECLTSLDYLINAENQKLDSLKFHKKGLMQQLFPSFAKADA